MHMKTFSLDPPWNEHPAHADRLWRAALRTVGSWCDEIWLRFGQMDVLAGVMAPADYRRLKELLGPYWGRPDPIPVPPGSDWLLRGVADALAQHFQTIPLPPEPRPRYSGCAVAPLTPELLDLLAGWQVPDPARARDILSQLADHWHLRRRGRDLLETADGMAVLVFHLNPREERQLRAALGE